MGSKGLIAAAAAAVFIFAAVCFCSFFLPLHPEGLDIDCETADYADIMAGNDENDGYRIVLMHDEKLDINTATEEELLILDGIGQKLASAIVEYRSLYGPFSSPADIMKVPGISPDCYDGIKDSICAG